MKTTLILLSAASLIGFQSSASAVMIAGTDFSTTSEFTGGAGPDDLDNSGIDDLNLADNITVTDWSFLNGGKFENWDNNAQAGMPLGAGTSPVVTKLDGSPNDDATAPILGTDVSSYVGAQFSINIPATETLDLTSLTFDFRKATGGDATRWLAFKTNLDAGLVFSENGLARDAFDSETVSLADERYQNLTNMLVTFQFYAGGGGSGDIDIDTIIINGDVTAIPEPSAFALFGIGVLGLAFRRRR